MLAWLVILLATAAHATNIEENTQFPDFFFYYNADNIESAANYYPVQDYTTEEPRFPDTEEAGTSVYVTEEPTFSYGPDTVSLSDTTGASRSSDNYPNTEATFLDNDFIVRRFVR